MSSVQQRLEAAYDMHRCGRLTDAVHMYRAVLLRAPLHWQALHLLGLALHERGENVSAVEHLERAIRINPRSADVQNNLGVVFKTLGERAQALASYDKALLLEPSHADAHNNRGVVLRELLRPGEALLAYDEALRLKPFMADVWNNKGVALQDLHRFEEALACYGRAIELQGDYADAHWNEARCRLLLGDYAVGWAKYEWRWRRPGFTSRQRSFDVPQWRGRDGLRGKTILLHAEQGLGDTLQFLRYVPLVHALGAKVLVETQPALLPLVSDLPGISAACSLGEVTESFDYHCPLLSLPLAFGTTVSTIPPVVGMRAGDDKRAEWSARLGASPRVRVGIAWSGNPAQQDNALRSLELRQLLALNAGLDVELISLQKELRSDSERELVAMHAVSHFGDELRDFEDTAALIECADLVVSVCTSVAHLACSMGKPTYILLQRNHDWRWLLSRDDSPWYPSARLFRQSRIGDWSEPLERARAAIESLLPPGSKT